MRRDRDETLVRLETVSRPRRLDRNVSTETTSLAPGDGPMSGNDFRKTRKVDSVLADVTIMPRQIVADLWTDNRERSTADS